MDQKVQYQDFEPFFEWEENEGCVTLTVMLPGFRRDQMKVQVTSTLLLRINGEREIAPNLRRRFAKELPIPSHCDTNNVSAKFERGMLYIKFPKLVAIPPPNNINNQPQEHITTNITTPRAPPLPTPPNKAGPEPVAPQKAKEEPVGDYVKDKKGEKERIREEKEKSKAAAPNDDQKLSTKKFEGEAQEAASQEKEKKEKEAIKDEKEKKGKELGAASKDGVEKKGGRMAQRLKTRVLDFTLTLGSSRDGDDDNNNNKGFGSVLVTRATKRTKVMMNIILVTLLVMVIWTYLKNSFSSSYSSSSSSHGGSKFHEL